jgi:propanol-preferring alcohol dehydrogenase
VLLSFFSFCCYWRLEAKLTAESVSVRLVKAMVLEAQRRALSAKNIERPSPGPGQVLIQVRACAVCRTDLHVVDGELTEPKLPLIPGHEVVGVITEKAPNVDRFQVGERVGVPWLGWTCGTCPFCLSGRENLCDRARFTGYTLDGGYAEFTVGDQRFCFRIPEIYTDAEAAPLLCAGLIGYRSLGKTLGAKRVGIYGFGAAAHIITQVARFEGREIYAFTREGDEEGQKFALSLGAIWAGSSGQMPPEQLDAAILFAPTGELVPLALKALAKGGIVVCGGIHMSDVPSFPYELLWQERLICSVANLTRRDGEEFFSIAPRVPVRTAIETFPLARANEALERLRTGRIKGAAVLIPNG